eukprot:GCRY01001359.1.p1 GENE.GCRY01001359.1~~GCRY01001359.1.p1  ORF type:complete len:187 (+),score=34.36 GCRY01001359.1:47-607(+)
MRSFCISSFLVVFCFLFLVNAIDANTSHGFNSNIKWLNNYEEGLNEAALQNKPAMVLIHKSWCGACKRLKSTFSAAAEIEKLSEKFVMINLEDDEEKQLPAGTFQPDGGYIPRIFFVDMAGYVHDDIYNEKGNPKYKYFYTDEAGIVSSMQKVLALEDTFHYFGDDGAGYVDVGFQDNVDVHAWED